jgi:cobalt-zinc-cadmium efflux system protein
VLVMTATFMVVEFVGGYLSNSLALMADAGHMLSDVAALGLSVFALSFARRPATPLKTYGYLRIEILAALVNGATLIAISARHLLAGMDALPPAAGDRGAAHAHRRHRRSARQRHRRVPAALLIQHNLNLRGAYLHVLGDLLGSVGAIAAAIVILTGWTPADPLISVFVALLILIGAWRLVRESVDVLLEAVPKHIDLAAVHRAIREIRGRRGGARSARLDAHQRLPRHERPRRHSRSGPLQGPPSPTCTTSCTRASASAT